MGRGVARGVIGVLTNWVGGGCFGACYSIILVGRNGKLEVIQNMLIKNVEREVSGSMAQKA